MVPNVWLLASRIRREERRLLEVIDARGLRVGRIDPREVLFSWDETPPWRGQLVLNREISGSRAAVLTDVLEADGAVVVNSAESTRITTSKWLTYVALRNAGVPTPRTWLAITPEAAMQLTELIDYPVVTKPVNASHGNRVSLANDRFALAAILDHCQELPTALQRMVLLQEYLSLENSDVRVMVVGRDCLGAIRRTGHDWRNNVSRGAQVEALVLTEEMRRVALGAAAAVGATICGVDLIRDDHGRMAVLEVNGCAEYTGFDSTGRDVADHVIDYLLDEMEQRSA